MSCIKDEARDCEPKRLESLIYGNRDIEARVRIGSPGEHHWFDRFPH